MAKTSKRTQKKDAPSQEELISPEQAWDVLKFANELYRGVYTPGLVNQAMQSITLNPQAATMAGLDAALANPKDNQQNLIGYSEFMELSSMIYKRVLFYFSGLLEFNFTYTCTNATGKEYLSKKYKDDLKIVEDFFDKFVIKQEFRTVLKQLMRQEAYFGVLRDEGNHRYFLQELPETRSLITGRWEMGIVYDFDMMLFLTPGVDIDMFPPIFKRMFNKAFVKSGTEYKPANPIEMRDSSWVYYVQTSPNDGFWCFKLSPEQTTVIPFLSPYMKDVVLQDLIRNLQKNSYIADASKIIAGEVSFLKDAKSSVRDAISLSPETLGKFLQLIKAGLPEAIKFVSAPLEDIKGIEFKGSTDLYDSYLKSTASASGINSRLIYSFDRQNVLETKLSMDVDINILRPVLLQFENFLEFQVNRKTSKYKFKFQLEGFNTSLDREERINNVFKYADSGIVLEQKFASAYGMNPFDFRRMLDEGKANGFVEKLTPILKSNQMPSEGGRPQKSDGDLSEGGADTKADGGNMED